MDVGRHEGVGTWMPAEWAASGKRLRVEGIHVEFLDTVCNEINEPRLNGLGKQEEAFKVRVIKSGTIKSGDGQVEVPVTDGAWSRVYKGTEQKEFRLRFFLEFPDGAARGDVDLGEDRVFFTSDGPLDSVGKASRVGLSKPGQLNVKRVRKLMDALMNIGRSPKLQWGEGMFTVGLFTMMPISAGGGAAPDAFS